MTAAEALGQGDGWARRRARIARHIERTAIELLAERGSAGVTVEQIATAAGISVRTFFRYFPSSDDVLTALPRRLNDTTCQRVLERPAGESVLDAFIAAVHAGMDDDDEHLIRLWGRAVQGSLQTSVGADSTMVQAYAEVIAFRLGVDADGLRAQVLATAIAGVTWATFLRWLQRGARESLPAMMEEAFDVLADVRQEDGSRNGRDRAEKPSAR